MFEVKVAKTGQSNYSTLLYVTGMGLDCMARMVAEITRNYISPT